MENVTPKKCLILASGVKNHHEYVDLVKERLGELLPVPEHNYQRKQSEYIGGEYRTWTESPQTNIQLAFQSGAWDHKDVGLTYDMSALLNRASHIYSKKPYITKVSGINHHFSDNGLFGINIEGAGSHSKEIMNTALEQLNSLKENINEEQLNLVKS